MTPRERVEAAILAAAAAVGGMERGAHRDTCTTALDAAAMALGGTLGDLAELEAAADRTVDELVNDLAVDVHEASAARAAWHAARAARALLAGDDGAAVAAADLAHEAAGYGVAAPCARCKGDRVVVHGARTIPCPMCAEVGVVDAKPTSCDEAAVRCRRRDRGEDHDPLPSMCRHGHVDEHGFAILVGACAFYRVCEHYRERLPVDGGWIRPFTPPMGYATPKPCPARGAGPRCKRPSCRHRLARHGEGGCDVPVAVEGGLPCGCPAFLDEVPTAPADGGDHV
jgi:hypothetical protein